MTDDLAVPVTTAPAMDLNADLGEGFGLWSMTDDEGLLAVVTSANVACGFHAGDPATMRRVTASAASRGVRVGAHVGYRDLAGFGRRDIELDPGELVDEVVYQIAALDGFCRLAGDRVRYVKPHGALYNRTVLDETQAAAVVEAVRSYDASLVVLGLAGSALLRLSERAGLAGVPEAFADRAYAPEGSLVPRSTNGSVLTDPAAVVGQAVRMATDRTVVAIDGSTVKVRARSLCLHGDTPGAVELAARVRAGLTGAGVAIAPFV